MREEILNHINSNLSQEGVYQISQIKNFVDRSLKTFSVADFNNDKEKIQYLITALHDLRDFTTGKLLEDNLRKSLINDIIKIENEIELGNESLQQEENIGKKIKENPVQGLTD